MKLDYKRNLKNQTPTGIGLILVELLIVEDIYQRDLHATCGLSIHTLSPQILDTK